jgi:RecB family exonuclease
MPKLANPPRPKGWQAPPMIEVEEGDKVVTHSEIDAYRQCPLKWKLAYDERWTKQDRIDDHPLSKGILWHDVMELHYTGIKHIQDGVWGQEQGMDHIARGVAGLLWNQETGEQSELQSLVWWMYQGYLEKYGYDPQWEILAVEVKFQARLRDPQGRATRYVLKGKLDLVIRDRKTRKIWIVDHKSGANLPDEMELDLADQFGVYAWLLGEYGIDVIGVIHSGARTTRNKGDLPENQDENGVPLKSTMAKQTLEQRMRRTLLNRGKGELQSVARDFWAVTVNAYPEYSDLEALPLYSSPDPRTCSWKCDFLDAHLMARKGRSIQAVLTEQGFVQHFEERY